MKTLNRDGYYTYADYASWPVGERWELIDGVPYSMSSPNDAHQTISGEISRQLANFLVGKPCKVYSAPFAVRLNANTDDDTVVEPDIFVVCDRSKLDGKSCVGAPDLVIEILSPETSSYDKVLKFRKYKTAGVREYWLVHPSDKVVQTFCFDRPNARAYGGTDEAPVGVLQGCVIDLKKVFAE
jgi:Uma2 family endonuclease